MSRSGLRRLRLADSGGSIELAQAHPFRFEFVPPPEDLRGLVNTYFLLHTDPGRIEEVMPAYSAQIFVFLRGTGAMHFAHGTQKGPGPVFINAPLMEAAPFSLEGPVACVGASLTHLGWASIARQPVDEVHDTVLAPADLFAPTTAGQLEKLGGHEANEMGDVVEKFSAVLREAAAPLRPLHATMIAGTTEWLSSAFSPPVEDLYKRLPLSERQVQRLCKRYFGVPPTRLLKRFRAVRAASLLAQDNLSDDVRDEVFAAYFDQSHLINDIRRYTGRTPRLLVDGPLVANTLDPSGHGPAAKPLRERLNSD